MNNRLITDTTDVIWHDYLALCKPKVVSLIVFTAIVGMFLATPNMVPWDVLLYGTLGIGLAASSAAAINHVIDHRIDSIMARTKQRPLPEGKVSIVNAIIFAWFLGTISIVIFVFVVSYIVWSIMKATIGIRISKEAERLGTDKSEVGVIAYGIRD